MLSGRGLSLTVLGMGTPLRRASATVPLMSTGPISTMLDFRLVIRSISEPPRGRTLVLSNIFTFFLWVGAQQWKQMMLVFRI